MFESDRWPDILIALAGFAAAVISGTWFARLLIAAIVLLLIVVVRFFMSPEWTILDSQKTVRLSDAGGRFAKISIRHKVRANSRGLTEYCFRKFMTDGEFRDFRIDGHEPTSVERMAREVSVCRRIPPTRWRQIFTIELTVDIVDGYPGAKEGTMITIAHPTKRVSVCVMFPQERPFTEARCFQRFGGHTERRLRQPEASLGYTRLEAKIIRPRRGAEYLLEWDW